MGPHPALSLFVWTGFAVAGQLLPYMELLLFSTACIVLAAIVATTRLRKLMRRSRYLLLALFVLFAFFTPGQRLAVAPNWLPLTYEGLHLCVQQLARVLSVIALVALLLERLRSAELVQGICVLAAPLRWVGGDPDRLAVRLSLVLWMVAEARAGSWREWLADPAEDRPLPKIAFSARHMRPADRVWLAILMVAVTTCLIFIA